MADLILADYNLPRGMTGVELARMLRERLRREVPAIILTGDMSTATLRDIDCRVRLQLHKPVRLEGLARSILDSGGGAGRPPLRMRRLRDQCP